MRFNCGPRVALLFLYMLCLPSNAQGQTESIAELDQHVLDARRSIKSGHFSVSIQRKESADAEVVNQQVDTWIQANGDIRQDWRTSKYASKLCYASGTALRFRVPTDVYKSADRREWPIVLETPLTSLDRSDFSNRLFNPLILGFFASVYEASKDSNFDLERYVGSPLREHIVVTSAEWEGHPSETVSFVRKGYPASDEYTVVPSLGYSITRFVIRVPLKSAGWSETITDIHPKQTNDPNIWFPDHIHTTDARGTKIYSDEVLSIEVSQLNELLDKTIFTAAGMNLQKNTIISASTPPPIGPQAQPTTRPQQLLKIWDGENIRKVTKADLAALQVSSIPPESPRRRMFLFASGLCAAIGVGMLYRSYRRSHLPMAA